MDDNNQSVVEFTPESFRTTAPYDHLAAIDDDTERDIQKKALKGVARGIGITSATFEKCFNEAKLRLAGFDNANSVTAFEGQPIDLKCPGYICDESGILFNGGGQYGPKRICPHPLMPVRQVVNYDTGEHKAEVAFRTNGKWKTLIVPRSTLAMATRIVQPLSECGAAVDSENAKDIVTYFTRMLAENSDILPEIHSASRMGWVEDKGFLPYEEDLVYDGDAKFREMYRSIEEHGDKDAWFDLVNRIRKGANVIPRIMMAAAFASVLIKPLKGIPFIVHCWSDISGSGKTVALMLATSIWANPADGAYMRNMNTTNAAVEMVAGFLNNLPMCFDELCTRDKRDGAEQLVYIICESSGRSRASRNGGIQRQQYWKNCAITTGESPILTSTSRAGAENRVIDLEADGLLFDDPISVANLVLENYGFAGKMFIEALQQDGAFEELSELKDKYYKDLLCTGATSKQAIPMSLILAADKFVSLHVFDDVYNLRVEDVAHNLKSDVDVDTNRRVYEWLMGVISENIARFEPNVDERYTGTVWGRIEDDGNGNVTTCIIRSRFGAIMTEHGYNDDSFLKWAKRNRVIDVDSRGQPTRQVRINGVSVPPKCVCLHMNAFDRVALEKCEQVELALDETPF